MKRRYLDLPWGQVHLTEAGDPAGDLLLCVHQSPLSSRTYTPIIDRVVAGGDRPFHVVAPDTPGYGSSDPAPENWMLPDYAAAVWTLVEALGHDRVTLLGQHTGAIIAVEAASQRPTDIAALVLQGVPVYSEQERADRMATYAPSYVPADDASHLQFIWDRIGRLYPELDAAGRTAFVTDYLLTGPDYGRAYRAVFAHDLHPAMRAVGTAGIPVTVLAGEHDLVAFHHERIPALVPGARQVVIADSGDFAAMEQPDLFTRHLLDSLEI